MTQSNTQAVRAAIAIDKKRITNISRRLAAFLADNHDLKISHAGALRAIAAAFGYETSNRMLSVVKDATDATKEPAGGLIELVPAPGNIPHDDVWVRTPNQFRAAPGKAPYDLTWERMADRFRADPAAFAKRCGGIDTKLYLTVQAIVDQQTKA